MRHNGNTLRTWGALWTLWEHNENILGTYCLSILTQVTIYGWKSSLPIMHETQWLVFRYLLVNFIPNRSKAQLTRKKKKLSFFARFCCNLGLQITYFTLFYFILFYFLNIPKAYVTLVTPMKPLMVYKNNSPKKFN